MGVLVGPLAITYFFELMAIFKRDYSTPGGVMIPTDSPLSSKSPSSFGLLRSSPLSKAFFVRSSVYGQAFSR